MKKLSTFCIFLFASYSLLLILTQKFDPEAYFGGDSGGYQMMSVNFAKGFPIMSSGGVAGDFYKDYKFSPNLGDADEEDVQWFRESANKPPFFSFYRTPGYIFFLGTIYKLFGVSPLIAKYVQMLLLVAIAAFLPLIGYFFWKKTGILAGILSGSIFIYLYARSSPVAGGISNPNEILTEPLTTFSIFLVILSYIYFSTRKNLLSAFLLGVSVALSLLVKAILIFIPPIFLINLIIKGVRKKITSNAIVMFLLGVLIVIVPWSTYATRNSGEFVLLSTQGDSVLLDGNNEFSTNGSWNPKGYSTDNPEIFYNQLSIKPLPPFQKLVEFYKTHLYLVPVIFPAKISAGFENFYFFKTLLVLIIYENGKHLLRFLSKLKYSFLFHHLLSIWPILILFIVYQQFFPNPPYIPVVGLLSSVNILLGLVIVLSLVNIVFTKTIQTDIPEIFNILTLSALLFTLAIFGYPRFIQVFDFIFILTAVHMGMKLIFEIKSCIYQNQNIE